MDTVSGKVQWPCPVYYTYAWGRVCKAGLVQEQVWGGAGGAGRAEGPGEAVWSCSLWAGPQADGLKRGPGEPLPLSSPEVDVGVTEVLGERRGPGRGEDSHQESMVEALLGVSCLLPLNLPK